MRLEPSSSPLIYLTINRHEQQQPNTVNKHFGKETPPRLMNEKESDFILEQAERTNGQLAMIGFIAALGAYVTTGQIIPGVF